MNPILLKRLKPIDETGVRTPFERDHTAILHSRAFKRLKHKTQVFVLPSNDHITTRLEHSLYVSSISSIICRNLAEKGAECDPMLARTIAIGHDLGHSPFGHAGEKCLHTLSECIGGFSHERHSLRIIDKLEKTGDETPVAGLNLTLAVRDGIVNHCGESFLNILTPAEIPAPENIGNSGGMPCTLEGCVVRLVDKISYMGRDIEDAVRAGFISDSDIPAAISAKIGTKNGEIVDFFVNDIVNHSAGRTVQFSDEGSEFLNMLMKYNYENIYHSPQVTGYIEHINRCIEYLYQLLMGFLTANGDDIRKYKNDSHLCVQFLGEYIEKRKILYFKEESFDSNEKLYTRILTDYISGLTDRFVFDAIKELFIPKPVI